MIDAEAKAADALKDLNTAKAEKKQALEQIAAIDDEITGA